MWESIMSENNNDCNKVKEMDLHLGGVIEDLIY